MTTATNIETNTARSQADAQMGSIRELVAALTVDYDRLQELQEMASEQRSIIHGTMRPVDLIPEFLDELTAHDRDTADSCRAEIPPAAMADDDHDFWDSGDAASILDSLFDALDSTAPDGCYFGAHPGDGSDYGFWLSEEYAEELADLEEAANGCESYDEAVQSVMDDALSVEIRTDWHAPGDCSEPTEFRILLCTGGPAVQIRGEMNQYAEPCHAWLEYQDWFTPWTERTNREGDQDALLTYARCFYFGE